MSLSPIRWVLSTALLFGAVLAPACACDEEPGLGGQDAGDAGDASNPPSDAPSTLTITPSRASLRTDGVTPATQTFTVMATWSDGRTEDVTARASWTLTNPTLGAQSGATFTSGLVGGTSTLRASVDGAFAEAQIDLELRRILVSAPPEGPAIPGNPGELFEMGTEVASRAPRVVYPNDGTLFPRNLGGLEVHYRPRRNTLFEITFASPRATVVVYTRCTTLGEGCVYTLEPAVFAQLGDTNHGGDPVSISVRGTTDSGGEVGRSNAIAVSISEAPIAGGLYYWTTSNGTGIMRVDFGASEQVPERFFPFRGGGCFGCHALSRNGRRMSLSSNGIGDGRMTILDVASRRILLGPEDNQREQFQSWNPTSDKFAGVWADSDPPDTNIRIRDGDTGAVVETVNVGFEPDHPDWSPIGDRIAFTRVTRNNVSQRPGRGGISYMSQLAGGGWSAPVELVPPADSRNRYYPAYAPDGQFLVYNESKCPDGLNYEVECDADADPSAKLWAILADGGRPFALARANAPGIEDSGATDLSNTFPKWAPFVDPLRADGSGRVMWMTFSSRRKVGLRAPVGSNQLLWMVAVDADAVEAGRDGSFAAFALPFQDFSTSNHIAQWTARIVPPPPDPGTGSDGGTGQPDPGGGSDGGQCRELGEMCLAGMERCCSGARCSDQGGGLFVCRPDL